jgi:hypothetical protein
MTQAEMAGQDFLAAAFARWLTVTLTFYRKLMGWPRVGALESFVEPKSFKSACWRYTSLC